MTRKHRYRSRLLEEGVVHTRRAQELRLKVSDEGSALILSITLNFVVEEKLVIAHTIPKTQLSECRPN
jgi:hypothetical protein